MRAARFARHGDPSVMQVDTVPEPRAPVGDEVLVDVAASSVNGTDLGLRRGDVRLATWGRLPFTPGFDLAGEVLACGPAVTAFLPGDHVMALLPHSGGGMAERVLLRQSRAALVPASVPLEQAAALPLAGLTALQAVYGLGGLAGRARPAEVLVVGAAGGIGAYAVQLAVLAGARVTGTARQEQQAFVRDLGAADVVDHRARDVAQLDGRWQVVLDAPGAYGPRLVRLLTDDGVLVSTRALSAAALRGRAPRWLRPAGPRTVGVMTSARSQDLAHLAALVDAGRLRIPVDRVLPLEQVAEAHRVAQGGAVGKVVVRLRAA